MTDVVQETVDARAIAMRTLMLDLLAARAVAALEARGIGVVLLKGRVTANWLYHDAVRPYGDIDLLIDPSQKIAVLETLGELGYHHWMAGADPIEYGSNEVELIGPGRVCIDLHHTLLGITADPTTSWAVLSANTDQMTIGGRSVRVLPPAARAMHLALHVAQNGPVDRKAVCDLERGLDQLPISMWRDAQQIAEVVGASEAFSAGLRVSERGREVCEQLRLRPVHDVELILRSWSVPQESLQVHRLMSIGSVTGRLRFVGRKLWPTAVYITGRNPAATSASALLLARLRRMTGLPVKSGVAIWNWHRARTFERRSGTPSASPTTEGMGSS